METNSINTGTLTERDTIISPNDGDIFIDDDTNKVYKFTDGEWIELQGTWTNNKEITLLSVKINDVSEWVGN